MSKPFSLLLLSLCLVTWSLSAKAQAPTETKPAGSKTAEKPPPAKRDDDTKNAEAKRAAKERRIQARSLLISLSADARNFRDPTLRSRSLARIADALWLVDAEQARLLFRKAWEASEVADQESQQRLQEEIRQQKAKTGGGFAVNLPPNVRREVLKLAAHHDRVLGEEFLEKLKAQKQEAANGAADANRYSSSFNEALKQRIGVARELLLTGDVERALQFAEAGLGSVTMETVSFLAELREKNATLADQRYATMLASANTNPQADANTVSLLSSYIFTPHLFVTFSPAGVSSSHGTDVVTPADVAPKLRTAFLQTAAGILLRPQPPADQDQSTSGVEGKYLVIKRLLSFFEQFATRDIAEAVRGQLDVLNSIVSDKVRRRGDELVRSGVEPEKPVADQEQAILDKIDRVSTSAERDGLYLQLAYRAIRRGDIRARDFVSKIEDSEVRKRFQAYTDAALVISLLSKKLTEQTLEIARKGDLTHIQRVWALTQVANQLGKTDREKAMQLVDETVLEVRRIDVSDPSVPMGLFAVANVLNSIDPARVWDATFDAVKAANSAEGFSGEDGELVLRFQSKGQSSVYSNDVPDFDVEGIFRELAKRDYDRAVELARGFQGEGPRAVATIAIARAVLEPKTTGAAKARN
jgi:hypothetical protein